MTPGSWSEPPIPGWIVLAHSTRGDALAAFVLAVDQAEAAGYHITTTWAGDAGFATLQFWRTLEELRYVIDARNYVNFPTPAGALRWVWPT